MKKIILILVLTVFSGGLFAQFAQPTYVKRPKTLQPGSWYMIGKWDSASAAYKDTIGFYLERDSIHLWFNKPVITHGNFSVKGLVNTDSSFYVKGVEFIKANHNLGNQFIGVGSGANNIVDSIENPKYGGYLGLLNTANGYYSLYSNTEGFNNIANGAYSLYSNTTGYDNIANGAYSLYSNTTGNDNVANGVQSLYSNTTGNYNIANGTYSLYSNTTGNYNIANGYHSLYSNTTGSYNVANGHHSLFSNTEGYNNIANGYYSLYSNTTGSGNIAIGYNSGQYADTAANGLLWIGEGDSNNAIIYGYHGPGIKRLRLNADVYIKNKLSFPIFSATINDTLTPTEAELTTAIGLTPAEAGSGGSFVVKSTSGCLYDIISDGTNYYCIKRKKLW